MGCDELKDFTVPDRVTEIHELALSYCDNLRTVKIPDSVTYIDDEAFLKSEKVSIESSLGSYAGQYAHEHNIDFIEIKL